MSNIAINTSRLSILEKLGKGETIITKSTNNPAVPGNTAVLAGFSTAQTKLDETNAAVEANKAVTKQLMVARDAAEAEWNLQITGLAGFTESATHGDAEKILSAGFSVRSEPVPQVTNVRVSFTGMPGHSEVRWKRESSSDAYVVQRSVEQITPTSWENLGTVTEAKYEGNGAIPGQAYWYRVAGVNRLGQGPWSEPAKRPVM